MDAARRALARRARARENPWARGRRHVESSHDRSQEGLLEGPLDQTLDTARTLAGGARVESSRSRVESSGRSVDIESTSGIDDGARGGDDDERLDWWVKDAGASGARARFGPWSSRKRVKEERAFVIVGGVVVGGGVVRLCRARKRRG